MTKSYERELTFTVQVLPSEVDHFFNYLQRGGYKFDPNKALACTHESATGDHTLHGADAKELIQQINNHLTDRNCRPLLPENPEEWSIPRLQEFLELALLHFDWDGLKLENCWWIGKNDEWDVIAEDYSIVFTDP